ncbi:hypothetical protein DPMN_147684 [Dreissena polymorpha]|uniref:Uncharacterized protein n=1 Tax=Dreissena polymorpha TaxID=45954 RepID=A0A9D4F8Q1_DREPO|nr:hypothetical protein DPMN_147684 [Dreissena polymorpha]
MSTGNSKLTLTSPGDVSVHRVPPSSRKSWSARANEDRSRALIGFPAPGGSHSLSPCTVL